MTILKEWPVELWIVLRDGLPFDYAFSRSAAFQAEKRRRGLEPDYFWSVTRTMATISVRSGERKEHG